MMLRTLLSAAALLTLTACATGEAQTADAGPRECFRSDAVVHYEPVDQNTVRVHTPRAQYVVTVTNAGALGNPREPLYLQSANGEICTGNGLGVNLLVGDPPRQLHVTQIARAEGPTGS